MAIVHKIKRTRVFIKRPGKGRTTYALVKDGLTVFDPRIEAVNRDFKSGIGIEILENRMQKILATYRPKESAEHSKYNRTLRKYKNNSRKRDLVFSLTEDEFNLLLKCPCYYCLDKIAPRGIDRRDNTLGYVIENCVPACRRCNYFKSNLTETEFLAHVLKIAEASTKNSVFPIRKD